MSTKRVACSFVVPMGSHEGYADMADFVDRVGQRRARDLLTRAIQGRGAFRRFKDTLFEFPELRTEWFTFHDRRMRRRAVEWLADNELVARAAANDAIASLDDLAPPSAADIPALAAAALSDLYGQRLVRVVLFGSHAREDADLDSDVDLLVVLRGPVSPWDELRYMDDVLWRLSLDHGVTLSAHPVGDEDWATGRQAVLVQAREHGVPLS